MFFEAVERNYSRFLDTARDDGQQKMHPASEIRQVATRYSGPTDYTDLILLKH
jgi:hypothetical protein